MRDLRRSWIHEADSFKPDPKKLSQPFVIDNKRPAQKAKAKRKKDLPTIDDVLDYDF